MTKESVMQRLIRFLRGEAHPPNAKLDDALRRASRKVAAKRRQKQAHSEPVGAS
jgi:hypothetical protein